MKFIHLANKVEESESKLYNHGQEKDFYSLDDKNNTIVKKLIELSMLYTKAQSDRMLKESQFKQIKEHGTDAPLITNNPLIMRLREESIAQEAKVASLLKIYDVNYPNLEVERTRLKELTSRLKGEVKRITNSIEADYNAALKAENLLFAAQEAQKKNVGNLQTNLVKHHILKRDMHANEQIYQGLLSRMKEASVASTMVASNSAVIAPAEFPFKPYRPRKFFSLAFASIIGLAGGVGLAFLLEYFDSSVKSLEEMERLMQTPDLGSGAVDIHRERCQIDDGDYKCGFGSHYSSPVGRCRSHTTNPHLHYAFLIPRPAGKPYGHQPQP